MFHYQEKKIIYLAALAAGAFILISLLIIFPNYQNIKQTNQRIFDLRTQLEIKYAGAKQVHRVQIKFGEAKKITNDFADKFLKKGQELALITKLEALAEQHNLTQNISLNPEPQAFKKDMFFLETSITLTGAFKDIMDYLDSLNKDTYFISLTNLNFTKGGAKEILAQKKVDNPLTLNLKAQAYAQN